MADRPTQATLAPARAARLWACLAFMLGVASVTLAVLSAASQFPAGLIVLGRVTLAVIATMFGLVRRGAVRTCRSSSLLYPSALWSFP